MLSGRDMTKITLAQTLPLPLNDNRTHCGIFGGQALLLLIDMHTSNSDPPMTLIQ